MSLPSGYKKLEYIESSGTQFIDTGIKAKNNTKVIVECNITYGTAWVMILGSYDTGAYFSWWANATKIYAYYGSQNKSGNGATGKQIMIANGSKWSASANSFVFSDASFTAPSTMYLFSVHNGGSSYAKASMKLYSCQIYDNGTLVRDFIPCKNTGGAVGLWDDVNSVFYGNAGTGTFTAGPVIAIAADESEITKLEYIQSNGTQYIDTGIVPKNNTRVDADCDITYGTNWIMILGSYDPNKYFSWWANGAKIYAYYGTSNKNVAGENRKQTLSANKNIWTAGNSAMSFSEVSFTANSSIYLFSVHNGGSSYANASMKLYSCQIYDNGTLVRDFIAAKLSDGTVGLYDKLSGLLYINAGTGTFEAGPSSLNLPVNIGGTWKDANEVFVNIGGTWKTVEAAFVNIGGTWKELG